MEPVNLLWVRHLPSRANLRVLNKEPLTTEAIDSPLANVDPWRSPALHSRLRHVAKLRPTLVASSPMSRALATAAFVLGALWRQLGTQLPPALRHIHIFPTVAEQCCDAAGAPGMIALATGAERHRHASRVLAMVARLSPANYTLLCQLAQSDQSVPPTLPPPTPEELTHALFRWHWPREPYQQPSSPQPTTMPRTIPSPIVFYQQLYAHLVADTQDSMVDSFPASSREPSRIMVVSHGNFIRQMILQNKAATVGNLSVHHQAMQIVTRARTLAPYSPMVIDGVSLDELRLLSATPEPPTYVIKQFVASVPPPITGSTTASGVLRRPIAVRCPQSPTPSSGTPVRWVAGRNVVPPTFAKVTVPTRHAQSTVIPPYKSVSAWGAATLTKTMLASRQYTTPPLPPVETMR